MDDTEQTLEEAMAETRFSMIELDFALLGADFSLTDATALQHDQEWREMSA